jgi:uncharacterized membrane-anchored protein
VSVGRNAELRVPTGYLFADEKGARAFIEGMRSSVPKGIAGVLQPRSGTWWAALEFRPLGYVKDEGKEQLDPDAILKKLGEEVNRQQSKPQSVTWERKPDYDASQHSLEWAVRISGGQNDESVIRHTVRFMARRGVLDAVVNRPARESSDLTPLRDALKEVSFKDGERYAEYKVGDKISPGGLEGLVTLGTQQEPIREVAHGQAAGGMSTFWIGVAAVVCIGFVGMVVVVKKIKRSSAMAPMVEAVKAVAFPPQAAPASAQAAAPRPAPVVAAARPVNGTKPHHHDEKIKPAIKTNGHHPKNKRKVFNYQKFYTEMVLSGPAPSLMMEANGYEMELNRMAGAGHAAPAEAPKLAADSPTLAAVNSELIANQRSIIEEQKRLIQEQTKLIEERTRLIAEKNQLLKRQSEMIDNNLV